MISVNLDFGWEGRELAQADDARRLSEFVSGLPNFDSIYASWLKAPKANSDVFPVPLSEEEAKAFLRENINRSDSDGSPLEWMGSFFSAIGHAGLPPYDFRESSYARTNCMVGGFDLPNSLAPKNGIRNSIQMELSRLRPSTGRPWRASELRPLMKFARDIWNVREMEAYFAYYASDFPKIVVGTTSVKIGGMAHGTYQKRELTRQLSPRIGWITYLPPDLAARAKYPADVEVEALPDGAALVTLCEEPFDQTDTQGLARLHALEAALRPIQS
jgi:hypothetical protein